MDFRVVGNGHRQSLHGAQSGDTIMWYVVLDVILLSGRTAMKVNTSHQVSEEWYVDRTADEAQPLWEPFLLYQDEHEGSEVPQRPQQCSSGGMTHPASIQR